MKRQHRRHMAAHWLVGAVSFGVLAGTMLVKLPALWVVAVPLCSWPLLRWGVRARWIVIAILVGLSLGYSRGHDIKARLARANPYLDQTAIVQGRVIDDPVYVDGGQMEAMLGSVRVAGRSVPGKLRLRGFTSLSRGDQLSAKGKLRSGFGSYQLAMYFALVNVQNHDSGWANHLRARFQASLLSVLPEPHASFGFGLLMGARTTLSADFLTQLSVVGLTHLVAVSGYNLTIIIRASRRALSRLSPKASVLSSALLVGGFLLMTGFSASIVRAAVVAGLSLFAWYYGRTIQPVVLLLVSAAITVLANPLYLWGDVGWYLSFVAFFGILVLAPAAQARLFKREPRIWQQVLIESLCAIVVTSPIIMMVFGQVSLVAPIANLLVLPFVSLAMLLTLVAGMVGMLQTAIGAWAAVPAKLLLGFMVNIVRWLAGFPWASRPRSLSGGQVAEFYGLLLAGYLLLQARVHREHGKITGDISEEIS